MVKGLDVGSMNVMSAERDDDQNIFVIERNSFVEIEYSDMAEQMLSRSDVLHIRKMTRCTYWAMMRRISPTFLTRTSGVQCLYPFTGCDPSVEAHH